MLMEQRQLITDRWRFLSEAEKQSLKDDMREAAARMDDLLQKADKKGEWPSRQP
jgi:hypothetical protein